MVQKLIFTAMNKILFPTDFSDHANAGLKYAAAIAKNTNSKLVLMHALHLPIPDINTPMTISNDMMEKEKNDTLEQLKQTAASIDDIDSANCQFEVEYGFAATVICDMAKNLEVDLVIMGTRGTTTVIEKLLGSICSEVIKQAKVPVLAIPTNANFSELKKVVYTTDYSLDETENLKLLSELLKAYDYELQIVHVITDREEGESSLVAGGKYPHKDVTLYGGDVESALSDYLDDEKADLLVMCNHKIGFFEGLFHKSLTKQMALYSDIPLLIFHEK
jgi:nucleotide-binding universal stress UspA family protein